MPDLQSRWSQVLLTDETLDRLEALARAAAPRETGGIVYPDGWVEECPNRTALHRGRSHHGISLGDPRTSFRLEPEDVDLASQRWWEHLLASSNSAGDPVSAADLPDPELGPIAALAWHSHPAGPLPGSTPGPSIADLRSRVPGVSYLVVTPLPSDQADPLTGRTCHFSRY